MFESLTQEVLRRRYLVDLASVVDIAAEHGCSVHLVRKRIKDWKINPGKSVRRRIGDEPWNKGLTKDDDARLAAISKAHQGDGNPMAGKQVWNKGLTAADHPGLAAVSAKQTGREVGEETRAKQAAAKRGLLGAKANRWTGGTSKVGAYSQHRSSIYGRRVYQHRYVASQVLGRSLDRHEHVHHLDRNESNNVPENLIVLSSGDHARLHGAIYRGECDTRPEQLTWLRAQQINFEELS